MIEKNRVSNKTSKLLPLKSYVRQVKNKFEKRKSIYESNYNAIQKINLNDLKLKQMFTDLKNQLLLPVVINGHILIIFFNNNLSSEAYFLLIYYNFTERQLTWY
ncbi:hypothetical protein pb186bvf_016241 [Paramecium bursaria]